MIKIGTKKVNKIMIGNKEVLKVVVNGVVKYQKQVTPSYPYVAVITYNQGQGQADLKVYDTATGTQIGQARQGSYISKYQTGYYEIRDLNQLQYYIRDIMMNAGIHQGELPTLQGYELGGLDWTRSRPNASNRSCWLKIIDSNWPQTIYYNSQIASGSAAATGTITNTNLINPFTIDNNNNYPIPYAAQIKATTTQNGSTYNTYFEINDMGLDIYFDYS